MSDEYAVACDCGTRLTIKFNKAKELAIYCKRCQKRLFSQHTTRVTDRINAVSPNFLDPDAGSLEIIDPGRGKIDTKVANTDTMIDGNIHFDEVVGDDLADIFVASQEPVEDRPAPKMRPADAEPKPTRATRPAPKAPPADAGPKPTKSTLAQKYTAMPIAHSSPQKQQIIESRYQIIDKMGMGAIGELYLANNLMTKEKVVIHFFSLMSQIKAHRQRAKLHKHFMGVVKILRKLRHPHIINCNGAGNFNGIPFFTLEFLGGENLQAIIEKNGPQKLSKALATTYYLLSALEYTHEFNFLHRDIQPANIICLEHKKHAVKLINFGTASILHRYYSTLKKNLPCIGCPNYLPAEQIAHPQDTDQRIDIYGIGATLYHMLAGKMPFAEFSTQQAIELAVRQHKFTPLKQLRKNLPEDIYRIVETAMAFDPQNRYPSVIAFKQDVENFVNSIK